MKYQAPPNIRGSISVGGENIQIAEDGSFELPDHGDYMSILPFGCQMLPATTGQAQTRTYTDTEHT